MWNLTVTAYASDGDQQVDVERPVQFVQLCVRFFHRHRRPNHSPSIVALICGKRLV